MNSVIHLATPYLFYTGTWIYNQIYNIESYEVVVFTQKKEINPGFSYHNVISIEDKPFHKRLINKIYRRITYQKGMFFDEDVKRIKPLLFHAHIGDEGWRWLRFSERCGIPLITSFYGMDVSKTSKIPEWRKRYHELFRKGRLFLVEGSFLKKQLIDIGCPPEKIIVQHLGVEIEKYQERKKDEKKKIRIIQCSSFREKKGLKYTIQAIAKLKESNTDFDFVLVGGGDKPQEQGIVELLKEYELTNKTIIKGKLSYNEMLDEMSNSDIFIHPSITGKDGDNEGGAPVVISDASALGLPVVSSFHADIPEVVIHNKTGILCEEKNVEQLTEALKVLINNSELRFKMGYEAKEHIRKEYNLKTQIRKLEKIYDSVIEL